MVQRSVSASNFGTNMGLTWGWPKKVPLVLSDAQMFSPCQPLSREWGGRRIPLEARSLGTLPVKAKSQSYLCLEDTHSSSCLTRPKVSTQGIILGKGKDGVYVMTPLPESG